MPSRFVCCAVLLSLIAAPARSAEPAGLSVNAAKKTVTVDCLVAPRKLPRFEQIYPVEVIATFPQGQKAHETVVTFTAKPSEVHKALEGLGLKPGAPVRGKGVTPKGPEVDLFLELPGEGGKTKRVGLEEVLIDKKTNKPLPKLKWVFTGSVMTTPDPEKDDKVYGADFTGTLVTLFPVTNEAVLQMANQLEEGSLEVETNPQVLPKVGTPIKLVIQVR